MAAISFTAASDTDLQSDSSSDAAMSLGASAGMAVAADNTVAYVNIRIHQNKHHRRAARTHKDRRGVQIARARYTTY